MAACQSLSLPGPTKGLDAYPATLQVLPACQLLSMPTVCACHALTRGSVAGRIASGRVRVGDRIKVLQHEGAAVTDTSLKVTRIEKRAGLGKVQLQAAVAGDVVSLAGAGDAAGIADTIAAPAVEQGLDPGPIDPPTLRCVDTWNVCANSSQDYGPNTVTAWRGWIVHVCVCGSLFDCMALHPGLLL